MPKNVATIHFLDRIARFQTGDGCWRAGNRRDDHHTEVCKAILLDAANRKGGTDTAKNTLAFLFHQLAGRCLYKG